MTAQLVHAVLNAALGALHQEPPAFHAAYNGRSVPQRLCEYLQSALGVKMTASDAS